MSNTPQTLFRRGVRVLSKNPFADKRRQTANALRDAGKFEQAAPLYRLVADATRDQERSAQFWVQAGNCAKEARLFSDAAEAYERANDILARAPKEARSDKYEQRRADAMLQYAHMWKASGNFLAARRHYAAAAWLGSVDASLETKNFPQLSASAMTFYPRGGESRESQQDDVSAAGEGQAGKLPATAFEKVAAVELRPLNPATLREAAREIQDWTNNDDIARAFGELAFLADRSPQAHVDHIGFASNTMIWPLNKVAGGLAQSPRQGDARARLRAMIVDLVARDTPFEAARTTPAAPRQATQRLDDAQADKLGGDIARSLGAIYEIIWTRSKGKETELRQAVDALEAIVGAPVSYVSFARERTEGELICVGARALVEAVRAWLEAITLGHAFDAVSLLLLPVQMGSVDLLAQRRAQLGSLSALYGEIDSILFGAAAGPEQRDETLAALLAYDAPNLSSQDARDLLRLMRLGPRAARVLLAIGHGDAARGQALAHEIVSYAQALKDYGLHDEALTALRHLDDDAATTDLLVEKALIAKVAGRFDLAAQVFERCYATRRDSFIRNELAMVLPEIESISSIVRRYGADPEFLDIARAHAPFRMALKAQGARRRPESDSGSLAPELAPERAALKSLNDSRARAHEAIEILGLGAGDLDTPSGRARVLRPVEFVRARVTSREPIVGMRVRVDGRTLTRSEGILQIDGPEAVGLERRVFNAWFETKGMSPGVHSLQLYFEVLHGGYRIHEQLLWINESDWKAAAPASAAIADPPEGPEPLDERIARASSQVFPANRSFFQGELANILLIRADQLGDTTMSLAAAADMKAHFPEARIDGLVSPGQVDLAKGSGIFDDVFSVSLPYDQTARMRLISLEDQASLRDMLAARRYDLAVDLSPGSHTRPLLKLVRARYTAGFKPNEFPWLSFGVDLRARDPGNGHEGMAHSRAPQVLVEALHVAAHPRPLTLDKTPLEPEFRKAVGLGENEPFAVFHTGARTASRKWPLERFLETARRVHEKFMLRTVLMLDKAEELSPEDAAREDAILVLRGQPTFAQFDGLVSNCAVLLGNDSGPKHLAALRGTPTVSIHMGAVNWSEWGQDGAGVIVSRRVPCYGCGIELSEECGRGLPCLYDISVDDVFSALFDELERVFVKPGTPVYDAAEDGDAAGPYEGPSQMTPKTAPAVEDESRAGSDEEVVALDESEPLDAPVEPEEGAPEGSETAGTIWEEDADG